MIEGALVLGIRQKLPTIGTSGIVLQAATAHLGRHEFEKMLNNYSRHDSAINAPNRTIMMTEQSLTCAATTVLIFALRPILGLILLASVNTAYAETDPQKVDSRSAEHLSSTRDDSLVPRSDLRALILPFDKILRTYVVDGRVNYSGIAMDPAFFNYVKSLEAAPRLTTRELKLVYWINAYNALAIKGIIDGKSPASLFGRYRYFRSTTYKVGGRQINLYDLEREILIPLGEPRIHFAIVCASASCPKLLSHAYTPNKLAQQLDSNTRDFINDPSRNRFDRKRKIAYLSKIFDWFEDDFEKHSGTVQRYLAHYVDDPELAKQLESDSYKIEYLKYDWSLNGSAP